MVVEACKKNMLGSNYKFYFKHSNLQMDVAIQSKILNQNLEQANQLIAKEVEKSSQNNVLDNAIIKIIKMLQVVKEKAIRKSACMCPWPKKIQELV